MLSQPPQSCCDHFFSGQDQFGVTKISFVVDGMIFKVAVMAS